MGNQLDEFIFRDPIFQRAPEVEAQLLGAIEGNEGGDGDQAPVALGEAGPFPDIAKENLLGEFRKLRREIAE